MQSLRLPLSIATIWLLTVVCGADDTLRAVPTPSAEQHAFIGSASCAATACHGGERAVLIPDQRSGGEYELWRTQDPHARAHEILGSDKFENILQRLKIIERLKVVEPASDAGKTFLAVRDQAMLQECMNCHNPNHAANRWSAPEATNAKATFAIECETCHGNASHWIDQHAHRDWNRPQAAVLGFQDMKHYMQRAKLCADCHVGNGDRDMNHDMIAAGHPPLRFELASYVAKLPKHWNDAKERTLIPNRDLQLWMTGQLVTLDHSLALLESRARRADTNDQDNKQKTNRPSSPWPEFAEYSCTACHQALTSAAGWSADRKAQTPHEITLRWTNWNHGFWQQSLAHPNLGNETSRQAFLNSWQKIQAAMEGKLSVESNDLRTLASDVQTCRQHLHSLWPQPENELHGPAQERDPSVFTLLPVQHPLKMLEWKQQPPRDLTHDQALQAYGLLVATVQSRYDQYEPAQVAPEVLVALRNMKQQLVPLPDRPFGKQVDSRQAEFTQQLHQASRLLEGAKSP
jgi:Cytochrome c554 and c-prime